jgi:hypothetical protein
MMTRQPVIVGLGLLLATVALAAAAPPPLTRAARHDVAVTVYNGGLGLVKDVRELRLPAGDSSVQFADVATHIDPTSVHLRSLDDPAGLGILEQNYEYDLLSSQKLMEKYVGRTVRLHGGDGTYHEATLLSTDGPVFEINGQIHLGQPGQLVLPALPENLVSTPTLVWLLRNHGREQHRVEASYLTAGITWKADYVLLLNTGDDRADLTGWVTIDNKSGATYDRAALTLVAGDVHRVSGRRTDRALSVGARASSAEDASREFAEESLFEYHLYTLDGRTTIKDKQTKQLALMSAIGVPVRKRLVYHGASEYYRNPYGVPIAHQKVGVYLDVENRKDRQLGKPLPAGTVRVYQADSSGGQQFVGEDAIDHTPEDERVRVRLGNAFDVVGERTQTDWRKLGGDTYEVEWRIALRNHKAEAQTVTVIEPVPGDWQVLSSSHAWEKIESHTLKYEVPVPAKAEATVRYRLRIRY